MTSKCLILACGAVLALSAYAHNPPTQIFVPVNGGWDARAACDSSTADGFWTFTVTAVNGNISKVNVQTYRNALPTSSIEELDVYRVCAGTPDPLSRPQQQCLVPQGPFESAGSVTINKPKVGSSGALTLLKGDYCIRPVVTGKGNVTIQIGHP